MAKKNQEYALKDPNTGSVITMDYGSSEERSARDELLTSFRDSPIPNHSVMANLGLHLTSKTFSRMLFMNEFYKMGLDGYKMQTPSPRTSRHMDGLDTTE